MRNFYYFVTLLFFMFYGCRLGCFDYNRGAEPAAPKLGKYFTIINHTDNEYKDNILTSLCPHKTEGKWKLAYNSNYDGLKKQGAFALNKIIKINPNETVNKNEKGDVLLINSTECLGVVNKRDNNTESLFLFSLDGGKKRVFFGAHNYHYKSETNLNKKTCVAEFVRWKVHPALIDKNVEIHIYYDRIDIKDDRFREVEKIRLNYSEYAEPNALPLLTFFR